MKASDQQTHRMVDSLIDEFLELESKQQMHIKLQNLSRTDSELYSVVTSDLLSSIIVQSEQKVQINKLHLLELICASETQLKQKSFKTSTIYHLVAITKGSISAGLNKDQNIKGNFMRNLKKQPSFWGTTNIENISSALINKTTPTFTKTPSLEARSYVWQFFIQNPQILPIGFDISSFLFRHILMLRPDVKSQQYLLNKLVEYFLANPIDYKVWTGVLPEFLQLEIDRFAPSDDILPCFKKLYQQIVEPNGWLGTLFRLITASRIPLNQELLTFFITVARNHKKFNELIQSISSNMGKIFIFLKHPPLFQASLKTLKQFILGPWEVTTLYSLFTEKSIQFWEKSNRRYPDHFQFLVRCVVKKYKETTITDDLLKTLPEKEEKEEQNETRIKEQIKKYDWGAFQGPQNAHNVEKQVGQSHRGIINIGNSCYMNSFLQCLFMTKQYRKLVLGISNLQKQAEILEKMRKTFPKDDPNAKNYPMIARQTIRPLAELQRFFSLLLKSKRPAINPTTIKNISPLEFQNVYQHDSIEFGRFLIESISKADIQNIFEGQVTMEIECPFCHAKRQKTQEFLDLLLNDCDKSEGDNQSAITLQASFSYTMRDEYLEDLVCETCANMVKQNNAYPLISENKVGKQQKKINQKGEQIIENMVDQNLKQSIQKQEKPHNKSVKRHWVSKFPKYLIMTLKRFQYDIKQNKNLKNQFKLELSDKFTLGGVQYSLYSIIVHRGSSANSGHYFTFAKQSFGSQDKSWLCLNDSTVSKIEDFSKVVEFLSANQDDTPYILFACEQNHRIQNCNKIQQNLILRAPLQSHIDKDDMQYAKSLSMGKIDLSMLKFGTGNYIKREQQQDDQNNPFGNGGFGGGGGNPIM